MNRTSLKEDNGMLFVYDSPRNMAFWMKNTLIPLDIIFLDPSYKIVDIQTMQPCPATAQTCPTYPTAEPAQYALEINAGKASEWSLKVGDQLVIKMNNNEQ